MSAVHEEMKRIEIMETLLVIMKAAWSSLTLREISSRYGRATGKDLSIRRVQHFLVLGGFATQDPHELVDGQYAWRLKDHVPNRPEYYAC